MKNTLVVLALALGAVGVILGFVAVNKPVPIVQPDFGAVSGPSIDGACFSQSGHTTCKTKNSFVATSTTAGIVCAIKSPNATSTLTFGEAALTTGTTTATVMTLAKSATQFATTTALNKQILNANDTLTLIASTTNDTLTNQNKIIFAPNQFFTVGLQGGNGGSASTYAGTAGFCNTVFEVNN